MATLEETDSFKYWIAREKAHIDKMQEAGWDDYYNARVTNTYQLAEDAITKQINDFYVKYAENNSLTLPMAKQALTTLEMSKYEAWAKEYVENKDFSAEANERMKIYNAAMRVNRLEMLKAQIGITQLTYTDQVNNEAKIKLLTDGISEYQRQAGILGETVPTVQQLYRTVDNIAAGSFTLDKSPYKRTFSKKLWNNHDALVERMNTMLSQNLIRGMNPRAMAKELAEIYGRTKYESERLAITETARVQAAMQKKAFEKNGYDEYVFIAEPTACEHCAELDEQIFKTKDMQPGKNAEPIHPNCKCVVSAYMDHDEMERNLFGKTFSDAENAKLDAIMADEAAARKKVDKEVRGIYNATAEPLDDFEKRALLYNDFDSYLNGEEDRLKAAGKWNPEDANAIWTNSQYKNSALNLHEIRTRDAIAIARENIPPSYLTGWFRNADSGYKPKIENLIIKNPETRNAALNIAHQNYLSEVDSDISFDDFLMKDITVYRGGNFKFVDEDVFVSFSFREDSAMKFGKNVTSITVKPIDTLGGLQTTGEAELLIPRSLFDNLYKPDLSDILGLPMTPQQLTYLSKTTLKRAQNVEEAVTSKLQTLAGTVKADLTGLDFRLKSESSLTRKIEANAITQGKSIETATEEIADALRYTLLLDDETFLDSYNLIKSELLNDGYEIIKVKNTWYDGSPYKGINTNVAKDGYVFELQYHTAESFELKNGPLHTLYEEFRDLNTPIARKEELQKLMDEMTLNIHNPPNINEVK